MDNLKKTLPSGAILEITMAEFVVGEELLTAVMVEAERINFELGDISGVEKLSDLDINSEVLNTLKNFLAKAMSSTLIKESIWKCLGRATRNGIKITPDIFDDEQARGDYLIIMKEALMFNLSPFFQSLGSLLKDIKKQRTTSQKSEHQA